MQKVKYDPKKVRLLAAYYTIQRPAYDQQPNHLLGQDAGPPDCDNRQLVGPIGQGRTGLGMCCPLQKGTRKMKLSAVYKPVRTPLAWRGGTKLPAPLGCARRDARLGLIRVGRRRPASPARRLLPHLKPSCFNVLYFTYSMCTKN